MVAYSKLYLEDTVETNGELYGLAVEQGYDLCSFIEFYLHSRLRELLDTGQPLFLS